LAGAEEPALPKAAASFQKPFEDPEVQHGIRLQAVLDTAVDGIILMDSSGSIMTFNPACERLFGYRPEEVIGRNVKMLMPPVYSDNHDQYLKNYQRTHDPKIIGIGREVLAQRKNESIFPIYLSVGEAKQGSESLFVGIISDLSARRETEERLRRSQRMESIGQLTGGIAHDFNNLLAIVSGNLELLLELPALAADARELATEAISASDRGAELVRRLLAFSRKQQLEPRAFDLNERLPDLVQLLQRSLGEAVQIQTHTAPDLWQALADPSQVDDAVVNLAINARDAMPEGGVLTIETANVFLDDDYAQSHLDVASGEYVMLAVTDTGAGMTPEVAARAFEPFFTTKPAGRGTGLGLSQVYGFVKQSGGHVAIYSERGRGTIVKLYLPRSGADADPWVLDRDKSKALPRGTENVLVVEDNPDVRRLVRRQLAELGYTVHEAAHGPEALKLLRSSLEVDLMFTDVVMPEGMTGYELAGLARECRPGLKVLFTSGYTAIGAGQEHDSRAGGSLLSKPYRKRDLGHFIRAALDEDE
jgi:PAS domain S-box-containing protein